MSTKKRLFELGIAQPEDELKVLRVENISLKEEVEKKNIELDIVKKNFQETLQKIIESAKAVNYDIVFDQPVRTDVFLTSDGTNGNHPYIVGDSGNASFEVNGDSGNSAIYSRGSMTFTSSNDNFDCGDVSFISR